MSTLHIIANFSAINDSIQKQNDYFNASHIGIKGLIFEDKNQQQTQPTDDSVSGIS